MKYSTDGLKAPSGRSLARIKQDAKVNHVPLDQITKDHGIDLSWRSFVAYLSERSELEWSRNIINPYSDQQLMPKTGQINMLVGSKGNYIRQLALHTLLHQANANTDHPIAYIDYAVTKKNCPPRPILFPRSVTNEHDKNATLCLEHLQALSASWQPMFNLMTEREGGFTAGRMHQVKPSNQGIPTLAVVYNPRKAVPTTLLRRMKTQATLLADSDVTNIMQLGTSKHWEQFTNEDLAMVRRALLANTHIITEQRVVNTADRPVILRREFSFTQEERMALLNKSAGIKGIMEDATARLVPWQSVAMDIMAKGMIPEGTLASFAKSVGLSLPAQQHINAIEPDTMPGPIFG